VRTSFAGAFSKKFQLPVGMTWVVRIKHHTLQLTKKINETLLTSSGFPIKIVIGLENVIGEFIFLINRTFNDRHPPIKIVANEQREIYSWVLSLVKQITTEIEKRR